MDIITLFNYLPMQPDLMVCPYCEPEYQKVGVHSQVERRYKCHQCKKTFSETKGTPFYGLHYPVWFVVIVLTLLANGCPVQAIVKTFGLDERTIRDWLDKAGQHAKEVQEEVVCNGQVELRQVQEDEMCVTTQVGHVWVATAMEVFSRLFLWGEVGKSRDRKLIDRLNVKVRAACKSIRAIVFCVDGFSAYPKSILKAFSDKFYSGEPGRPPHIPWADIHIAQVVKQRSGKKLKSVSRRVKHGLKQRVDELIALSQTSLGLINTAYIERLNATFRQRLPVFVRRTRNLARTVERVEAELFWCGAVYNFCTVHTSLETSPAVAAGLTEQVWSVRELLFYHRIKPKLLHGVL